MSAAPGPRRTVRVSAMLAFGVAISVLFGGLGGLALMEPDEGRNAEVAREMKISGAWLVPTLNGSSYLDKPSFFFKASALAQEVAGSTPGAARFPSAFSALLTLVCLFAFCRPRYGERAAALAVLIAGTSPLFFVFARLVIMDSTLALFVSAAIFAAVQAEDCANGRRRAWYLASAACAGIGTVVKGPVGFLLPGLVVTAFFLTDGRRGALRRCFAPVHLLLFFAIVFAWFIPLVRAQPDFLRYGLVEESFHRFTTPQFKRSAPFWYYLPVLLGGVFAWSVLLPGGAIRAWQARKRWTSADRLFVAWTAVSVLFFTLSNSKRPGYVLTVVLALAALAARLLARAWDDPTSDAALTVRRGAFAGGALFGLLGAGLLVWTASGRVAPASADFAVSAVPVGIGFLVLAGVATWAGLARAPRALVAALALVPAVLLGLGWPGMRAYAERRSAAGLTQALAERNAGAAAVACLECYPGGLSYSLGRPLTVVDADGAPDELKSNWVLYLAARAKALPPQGYLAEANLDAWLAQTRSGGTCLIAGKAMLSAMSGHAGRLGWSVGTAPGGWQLACSPPRPGGA